MDLKNNSEEILDRFDDERILKGLVTSQEIRELERKLIELYFMKAKEQGKKIIVIRNAEDYEKLVNSGQIFQDGDFYFFIDAEKIAHMLPVKYHLIDTDEGLFYAKLGCHSQ